jgi:tRNA (guanine-N7-)-methyltransferase
MLTIEKIVVEPPAEGEIVEPQSWFDTPGQFELEIGCGKGGFLLHRAMEHPEVRLLGIEWANKFFKHCADRMVRRGVTNVRVMRTDAKFFVLNHLPPECVSVLHLYHPDPWPKKRHHKRRLVQQPFVDAAVRALVRGGQWVIQSDHAEYFAQMRSVIGGQPEMREIPWEQSAAPVVRAPEVERSEATEIEPAEEPIGVLISRAAGSRSSTSQGADAAVGVSRAGAPMFGSEWQGTNFEIKYAREGREIYRAAFRRAESGS